MIPFWLKGLLIGLLAAAIAAWGWAGGAASKQKQWDLAKAAQVAAQLAATEQARATEQALQKKVNDANTARAIERQKADRIAAVLRSELGGLRDSITSFTSTKPDDSAAALSERCATTGELLETALRTSETCAIEGESVNSDLRAVLAAWPKQDR